MPLHTEIISKIVQSLIGLNIYKIILFGSYANGTATEDSDIDLLVILDTEKFAKTFDERMDRKRPISTALLEVNYQFPMDIIVYSKGEFDYLKNNEDFFVQEIEETGRELYGAYNYAPNAFTGTRFFPTPKRLNPQNYLD